MELKELTDRTFELFGVDNPDNLGSALMESVSNTDKLKAFYDLIDGDLSIDWLQMIYQYYLADRKEKKQDYTPKSLARFMGMLAGDDETIVDMCAGSGALIIQKWNQNHDTKFKAIEIDDNVIPFLLFNMVLRNIRCRVFQMNALTGEDAARVWDIVKGEEFGRITNNKPAL
jgi:type I restriction enzyme M protein